MDGSPTTVPDSEDSTIYFDLIFLILSSLDFEDEDNLDLGLSGPQNNEAFLPDSLTFYDRPMTKYDDIRPVVLLQTL